MIQFDFTPVYGVVIINGKYLYYPNETDDDDRQLTAEFQLELSWDSDLLMGTRIQKIVWLTPIPDTKSREMEDNIKQAYEKLNKQPIVSIRDNNKE